MGAEARISYAQHGEDIALLQAFAGQATGFYVDVGAADPVQHSVTKLFYDMGWRGINIEPIQEHFDKLRRERPRDINIQTAIDVTPGEDTLYVFSTLPGLTTTDKSVADRHRASGLHADVRKIAKTTLADVLTQHCTQPIQPIDFLKIDVEGWEEQVLRSVDLNIWRPRVLVVEATEPRTSIPSHQKWEHIVRAAGYRLAQFDGLNRFYATPDEPELYARLQQPASNYQTAAISKEKSRGLKNGGVIT